MTSDLATPIRVTDAAASNVARLAHKEGREQAILRLRVLAGGCSGFTYSLTFEDPQAITDEDFQIVQGEATVVVDPASVPIVEGSTLDFVNSMMEGGLKVLNPQATSECACGDSFSV